MDIDDIKSYSDIDFDDKDLDLEQLRIAAIMYLKNSGVHEQDNEEYNLAVKMLVDHWFNHKGITSKGYEVPYGFLSIVTQLRE